MIVLGVAVGVAYYAVKQAVPPSTATITNTSTITTPSPTTVQPTTTTATLSPIPPPRITDISFVEWIINEGREVCWRFRVSGEVDLRDKIEINGVYGYWSGHVEVILPNGGKAWISIPPNYTVDGSRFYYLSGSMTLDASVLDIDGWWEKSLLEGNYTASVVLYGPYGNKSVLFIKNFTYVSNLNVSISPAVWNSWNQSVTIHIINTGDVPLILKGVGVERSGTATAVGILQISEEVIMPGKAKSITAIFQPFGDVKEDLKGKTMSIDFNLSFIGLRDFYKVVMNITFPKN